MVTARQQTWQTAESSQMFHMQALPTETVMLLAETLEIPAGFNQVEGEEDGS
jgi:hypothetical protein